MKININIRNTIKKCYSALIALLLLGLPGVSGCYAQNSIADDYYNNNINTQNPSEAYYDNNLRAGPPTGPGGGGEGGNGGVGTEDPEPTPLGEAGYSLLLAGMAYTAFIAYRRYKKVAPRLPETDHNAIDN